ncbi:hypothetical protein [uncultured Leptotrichia sp.]
MNKLIRIYSILFKHRRNSRQCSSSLCF